MAGNRHDADITRVHKRGETYTVEGTTHGTKQSFHVDAKTLDTMTRTQARAFMQRTIHNLARKEE